MISNAGMLALNKALLSNPCSTIRKLKEDLNIIAATRTISRALRQMGWRNVLNKYCQIIKILANVANHYNPNHKNHENNKNKKNKTIAMLSNMENQTKCCKKTNHFKRCQINEI